MLRERIASQTRLSLDHLDYFAETASRRYKVFRINKRSTNEKRTIEQPSRSIKALQRLILARVIGQFPTHVAATAYKKGASIRENAERHQRTLFTVRLDFSEFFPSFHGAHVEAFLQAAAPNLDDADRAFVRRIVCRNDALTIGAPSSPALTNAMMFGFDEEMARWCGGRNLVYTRYADDLFISAFEPNSLTEVTAKVEEVAESFPYAKLLLNRRKTTQLSRKYRRTITGLVITPDGKVSIGRGVKRKLRSDIYRYYLAPDGIDPAERSRIAGMIAFATGIEPKFYDRLVTKYGAATIERIVKGPYIREQAQAELLE